MLGPTPVRPHSSGRHPFWTLRFVASLFLGLGTPPSEPSRFRPPWCHAGKPSAAPSNISLFSSGLAQNDPGRGEKKIEILGGDAEERSCRGTVQPKNEKSTPCSPKWNNVKMKKIKSGKMKKNQKNQKHQTKKRSTKNINKIKKSTKKQKHEKMLKQ